MKHVFFVTPVGGPPAPSGQLSSISDGHSPPTTTKKKLAEGECSYQSMEKDKVKATSNILEGEPDMEGLPNSATDSPLMDKLYHQQDTTEWQGEGSDKSACKSNLGGRGKGKEREKIPNKKEQIGGRDNATKGRHRWDKETKSPLLSSSITVKESKSYSLLYDNSNPKEEDSNGHQTPFSATSSLSPASPNSSSGFISPTQLASNHISVQFPENHHQPASSPRDDLKVNVKVLPSVQPSLPVVDVDSSSPSDTLVCSVTDPVICGTLGCKEEITSYFKRTIETGKWLNDRIINACQRMLEEQSKGKIRGWQLTLYEQALSRYERIEDGFDFVQVINVHKNHWIVVSNIGCDPGVLNVYDSMYATISVQSKRQICAFWKSPVDQITFNMINIQRQPNGSDCGVFAVAVAAEIVHGKDPILSYWDVSKMRVHLIRCLEARKIDCFPQARTRRIPLGNRYKKVIPDTVFCICRMPNDKVQSMIKCVRCKK